MCLSQVHKFKRKATIVEFENPKAFKQHLSKLNGEVIETVRETKLLGIHLTCDLSWNKNTKSIVKESNQKMIFLHKVSQFTRNLSDLKKEFIFCKSEVSWSNLLCFGILEKIEAA